MFEVLKNIAIDFTIFALNNAINRGWKRELALLHLDFLLRDTDLEGRFLKKEG